MGLHKIFTCFLIVTIFYENAFLTRLKIRILPAKTPTSDNIRDNIYIYECTERKTFFIQKGVDRRKTNILEKQTHNSLLLKNKTLNTILNMKNIHIHIIMRIVKIYITGIGH